MGVSVTVGTTISGFRLERLLGQGGMGVVYLAQEEALGRSVAVKLLAHELSEDEPFRNRFLSEARLAASLDHPSVVPIYQAGEHDGRLFLAMRYVEGEDLARLITREAPLELDRALAVLSTLASALDTAHARGLVHRDVKPSNVLLDSEGHPYLCDFGIARSIVADAATQTGQLIGTFAYLAPELIEGERASAASDEYAFACLSYELLSGHPPFQAEHEAALIYRHLTEPPPSLETQPQLDPVFERALAKDPARRFPSCQAFVDALAEPRPEQTGLAPQVEMQLPAPATSFLGRKQELSEAAALLDQSRLVTITGPGGAGKTRFALELARRVGPSYPGGVHWVPLATLTDPALVPEAIAQALTARGDLREEIGERRLLLLIDNLEQVVEAAPELAGLIVDCPNLRVLCTSRERLRVDAEKAFELPPLVADEGVALFCERAGLEPTDAIAELCARLEGLPLAIELAVARLRLLSPEQLLDRLSSRLDLLKGARDADPRQQTLRATIEWSSSS